MPDDYVGVDFANSAHMLHRDTEMVIQFVEGEAMRNVIDWVVVPPSAVVVVSTVTKSPLILLRGVFSGYGGIEQAS